MDDVMEAEILVPVCTPEEGCFLRKFGVVTQPVFTKKFWWTMGSLAAGVMLIFGVMGFFLFYPFKTVTFNRLEITNPRTPDGLLRIPSTGVVDMEIDFEKFTNEPGLIVRTVVRRDDEGQMMVLDSNTAVSTRKAGKGVTDAHYHLLGAINLPGKKTSIIFSIYYTLYGFRPMMVQYETPQFEIYDPREVR
jgi:hypothetical protein